MKPKRWNPETLEHLKVPIDEVLYKDRLAEVGRILYDAFCQHLQKSQNLSLGMIPEVQNIEPKRTGTDG